MPEIISLLKANNPFSNLIEPLVLFLGSLAIFIGLLKINLDLLERWWEKLSILKPSYILWGVIALCICFYGMIAMVDYYNFQVPGNDAANIDQMVWKVSRGMEPLSTLKGSDVKQTEHFLQDHQSFLFYPISMVYKIYNDFRIMLILRTIFLILAAWPIYLLTISILDNKWLGLGFAMVYLFSRYLHTGIQHYYHANDFNVFFIVFSLYFLFKENWLGFFSFFIISILGKEDIPFYFLSIGLYLAIYKKQYGLASLVIITIAAYFVLWEIYGIKSDTNVQKYFSELGKTRIEIFINLILNPLLFLNSIFKINKIIPLLWLLFSFGFVPLFTVTGCLFIIVPLLFQSISSFEYQYRFIFQYGLHVLPFGLTAFMLGTKKIMEIIYKEPKFLGRIHTRQFTLAFFIFLFIIGPVFNRFSHIGRARIFDIYKMSIYQISPHNKLGDKIIEKYIPQNAVVLTQREMAIRFAHRDKIYSTSESFGVNSIQNNDLRPDYVFFDIHPKTIKSPYFSKKELTNIAKTLNYYLMTSEYFKIMEEDGFLILKRINKTS